MSYEFLSVFYIVLCLVFRVENYFFKVIVIVFVEFVYGYSVLGFNFLVLKVFRKEL